MTPEFEFASPLQSALMSPPCAEVARRVRAGRTYAGLSVAELAESIGLGVQTIKRIEAGRRSARRYEIWAIAEACDLPRQFFEAEFQELFNHSEMTSAFLRSIDERLARMEACLGVEGPKKADGER
jgi:transcriptional regulator with XRE-family HTH domain